MGDELYKIVYSGEIGFDYEQEEVKVNLKKLCGFDQATVDRLFGGGTFVLKKNIDITTANKYRESLQKAGAMCDVQPMVAAAPLTAESFKAPPPPTLANPIDDSFKCPACGVSQDKGITCTGCGIFFDKYEKAQARKAEALSAQAFVAAAPAPAAGGRPVAETVVSLPPLTGNLHMPQQLTQYVAILFIAMALIQSFLGRGLMLLGFIFIPVLFLIYVMFRTMASGQELGEGFIANFDFTVEQGEEEGVTALPMVTGVLVALTLLTYYGLELPLGTSFPVETFFFLPVSPNLWNVPVSLFTSLFLHGSAMAAWGSIIFLCVFGPVVEKRIGAVRFLLVYLLAGAAAAGAGALAHRQILEMPIHSAGASGAIAGLVGIYIGCCSYRSILFPFPVLGLLSRFLSTALTVRLNAILVMALFFFANINSVAVDASSMGASLIGHLSNLGGLLLGMLVGFLLDPDTLVEDEAQLAEPGAPLRRRPPQRR